MTHDTRVLTCHNSGPTGAYFIICGIGNMFVKRAALCFESKRHYFTAADR